MNKRPLWKKVAKILNKKIVDGTWPVGTLLPSEPDLAQELKVSRDTLRRALGELSQWGLLERRPHIGTRVVGKRQVVGFSYELQNIKAIDEYGNHYPRRIQNIERIVIDEESAQRLGFPVGSEKIRFENVRLDFSADYAEPVVVTFVYVDLEAEKVYEYAQNNPNELIISLVEMLCDVECEEVKQTFSATAMPECAAKYFQVPSGSPALQIVRQYQDESGKTIVGSISYHPSDRFAFSFSARRMTNAKAASNSKRNKAKSFV